MITRAGCGLTDGTMTDAPGRFFALLAAALSFVADDDEPRWEEPRWEEPRWPSSGRLEGPAITARCLARGLRERPGEIGLAGKVEREGNIDQGLVSANQQRLGAFEPFPANVSMGRLTDGGLEGPGEMETAQACNRCQVVNSKIAFQVNFYVVKHAGQPASIKPLSHDAGRCQRRRADVVLKQSGGETGSQCFGKQPAGRSLDLKFR